MTQEDRATTIVVIQVAYRTLKRYFAGETEILQTLNPAVAAWLLLHEYIEEVLGEEGDIEFEITEKAQRAVAYAEGKA